jgi:hypothetical protein
MVAEAIILALGRLRGGFPFPGHPRIYSETLSHTKESVLI